MAVRRWAVRPDPGMGFVTREQAREAFMDAEAVFAACGGVVTIMGARVATTLPQEYLTTFLVVEWKDRTDAKPQPEPAVMQAPAEVPAEPEAQQQAEQEAEAAEFIEEDGLDRRTLLEEDVSAIPAALR